MTERVQETIPLVEEALSVTTREAETGRVRIRTLLHDEVGLARADLTRDTVTIERVPVGREVDAMPEIREEGDTLIVPVVEEILVVEKRLFLVEEVRLTRTRTVEAFEEAVPLRRMEAVVERHETQHSDIKENAR